MKATLTIEVPDDFEKGDCHECLLSYITDDWDVRCALMHGYRDCPLEIQGECETCKNIASALCPICSEGKTNYYERAECLIELRQENNQ